MSVNLALIPLALVMYVVMGKEKFEDLVKQSELVKYTKFKSRTEVENLVKAGGYDFVEQYGMLKTHFKGRDYFIWEIRDGYFCAVFSIYDNQDYINEFINKIEKIAGRCIFNTVSENESKPNGKYIASTNLQETKNFQKPKQITEQVFKTKFADEKLLIKTLHSIGLNCIQTNNEIICSSDNYTLMFTIKDGCYEFKITGDISSKEAYLKYKDIDTKYGKNVQKGVVESVKRKVAKSSTMKLIQEYKEEDGSVILTINV